MQEYKLRFLLEITYSWILKPNVAYAACKILIFLQMNYTDTFKTTIVELNFEKYFHQIYSFCSFHVICEEEYIFSKSFFQKSNMLNFFPSNANHYLRTFKPLSSDISWICCNSTYRKFVRFSWYIILYYISWMRDF